MMHWIATHWLEILPWALYGLSELMPLLPNKAQTVLGAVLEVGKAVVRSKGKVPIPDETPKTAAWKGTPDNPKDGV